MDRLRYEYIHEVCGEVAFYLTRFPDIASPIQSCDAVLLDGSQPNFASVAICGHCGLSIGAPSTIYLREIIHAA